MNREQDQSYAAMLDGVDSILQSTLGARIPDMPRRLSGRLISFILVLL